MRGKDTDLTRGTMPAAPVAIPQADKKPARIVSLDALRGLTIIAMIVVNSADDLHFYLGYPVFPVLLHATWVGFTLADAVFPSFLFIVGASVALSLSRSAGQGLSAALSKRVLWRSVRLFLLGLVVSNVGWIASLGHADSFRIPGVLQRIGISFLVASLLYATLRRRTIFAIAAGLLVAYWGLLFVPRPDGLPVDLHRTAANFVSWVDQAALGRFTMGGQPYDPEGLLSTLPAVAQCLLGVLVGDWMLREARRSRVAPGLIGLGVASLGAGLLWTLSVPVVKNLWTPSFVMVSSGVSLVALGLFYQALDALKLKVIGTQFLLAFGANSILVYVLHIILMPIISIGIVRAHIYRPLIDTLHFSPELAALGPMLAYVLFLWIPLYMLYRKHIVVRI